MKPTSDPNGPARKLAQQIERMHKAAREAKFQDEMNDLIKIEIPKIEQEAAEDEEDKSAESSDSGTAETLERDSSHDTISGVMLPDGTGEPEAGSVELSDDDSTPDIDSPDLEGDDVNEQGEQQETDEMADDSTPDIDSPDIAGDLPPEELPNSDGADDEESEESEPTAQELTDAEQPDVTVDDLDESTDSVDEADVAEPDQTDNESQSMTAVGIDFDGEFKPIEELSYLQDEPDVSSPDVSDSTLSDESDSADDADSVQSIEQSDQGEASSLDVPSDDDTQQPDVTSPDIGEIPSTDSDDLSDEDGNDKPLEPTSPPDEQPDIEVSLSSDLQELPDTPSDPVGLQSDVTYAPMTQTEADRGDINNDPSLSNQEKIDKQIDYQMQMNEDLAGKLAQELGPHFDELREHQVQSVHDYFQEQQLLTSLLRAR